MITGRDRRHNRAFDEAAGTRFDSRRDLLLRRRRHRVEIHEEMIRGEVAGEISRRVVSRRRRDNGNNHACSFSERAWCLDEASACLRSARANAFVFGAVRCLDVEGEKRRRTSSAKAAREVEACLTETKKSNHVHGAELTPSE